MRFFGEPWASAVCDYGEQVPTPVGEDCLLCDEPIVASDRGLMMTGERGGRWSLLPIHRECELRSVIGGIEHLTAGPHAVGSCYEGATLTYRQSALQAWDWVQQHGIEAAFRSYDAITHGVSARTNAIAEGSGPTRRGLQ